MRRRCQACPATSEVDAPHRVTYYDPEVLTFNVCAKHAAQGAEHGGVITTPGGD